jgi:flagellar basal-body rod modification protein FlgD
MAIPAIVASLAGGVLSALMQKVLAGGGAEASAPAKAPELNRDDFLRLLTVQLRNQDPLNPISNTDFIAQTAQFSALEQLQNVNRTLGTLAEKIGTPAPATAAALLGRVVTANGSAFTLEAGQEGSLRYTLPAAAGAVAVRIQDADGALVRTLLFGAQDRGAHQVHFDGRDDQGQRLPAGTYTYQVTALDSAGRALRGSYTSVGPVTGIGLDRGQLVLQLKAERVPLSAVLEVLAVSPS